MTIQSLLSAVESTCGALEPALAAQFALQGLKEYGPRQLLEIEITFLMARAIFCDGPASHREARLFRDVLLRVNPSTVVESLSVVSTVLYIKQLANDENLKKAHQKPSSLTHLESYDAFKGTDFSNQERHLLIEIAIAAASADGEPSELAKIELDLLQEALRAGSAVPISTAGDSDGSEMTSSEKAASEAEGGTKERQPRASIESLMEELHRLIGLEHVKKDVSELTNYIRVLQMRKAKGLKSPEVALHMVFNGNPGTGKTTVARLLAKIYRELGVVSKGHLVETDRSDLVAGYVGQTALKVKTVAEKALGGVLFIDEAYALKRADDARDFGNEAIETLLKFMEDNRGDLIVIVAGYPVEMKRFLDANPGLRSRFNKSLEFPDYSPQELLEIFLRFCREFDYKVSEAAQEKLVRHFEAAYSSRDAKFGNARLVRNMFERAITNVANRVIQEPEPETSSLEWIEEGDIQMA